MTRESGHHEEPLSADLVRSTAPPSAELWHEILERFRGVQERQTTLSGVIETLELTVNDAHGSEAQAKLGTHSDEVALDRQASGADLSATAPDPQELSGPPAVLASTGGMVPEPDPGAQLVEDGGFGFKDRARPADSLITSVEASAQRAWSGAAEVPEPAVETDAPEPVFYVPPFDEDVLPATSVAELSASALDAILMSEFGSLTPGTPSAASAEVRTVSTPESSPSHSEPHQAQRATFETPFDALESQQATLERPAPDTGPPRSAPTIEHSKILDILLGTSRTTESAHARTDSSASSSATTSNTAVAPPFVSPSQSIIVTAPPAPAPPPPVFAQEAPPPPPPPVFAQEAPPPPPPPPVFAEEAPSPPPLSPVFTEAPPPPSSVFGAELDVIATPEVPVVAPAPIAPDTPTGFSFSEPPTVGLAAPSSEALAAPPSLPDPSLFEEPAGHVNGSDPLPAVAEVEDQDDVATELSGHVSSAASMATEILSASPEIPTLETSDEREPVFITKDVTLIARGRKKRFRLH